MKDHLMKYTNSHDFNNESLGYYVRCQSQPNDLIYISNERDYNKRQAFCVCKCSDISGDLLQKKLWRGFHLWDPVRHYVYLKDDV